MMTHRAQQCAAQCEIPQPMPVADFDEIGHDFQLKLLELF